MSYNIKHLERKSIVVDNKHEANSFNSLFEHVKIQTNELCTRSCSYCYYGSKINNKDNKLPKEMVYKLIDELESLNFDGRLGLYEINEPLTDNRIFDFLTYATKKLPNAWHMLITNGDLLTASVLEKLYNAKLNHLYVSIYDKQSLKKIENIQKQRPDLFKIVEMMNFIKNMSIDNRGGNIKHNKIKKTLTAPCERIYKMIYVRPNGKVVSCFVDFYEVNVLGDVHKETLKQIWFGEKFKRLRQELDKGNRNFSLLCRRCDYPGKGGFFKKYSKN